MEIKLSYKDLSTVAEGAANYLIKEDENGLFVIDHYSVKFFSKLFLWMVHQPDENVNDIISQLDEGTSVEDLYCQLEEEKELEISKADLPKYKFYTDSIYGMIKLAEASNKLKAEAATLDLTQQIQALAEAFNYIGDQVGALNKEELKEKAQEVDEAFDGMFDFPLEELSNS